MELKIILGIACALMFAWAIYRILFTDRYVKYWDEIARAKPAKFRSVAELEYRKRNVIMRFHRTGVTNAQRDRMRCLLRERDEAIYFHKLNEIYEHRKQRQAKG